MRTFDWTGLGFGGLVILRWKVEANFNFGKILWRKNNGFAACNENSHHYNDEFNEHRIFTVERNGVENQTQQGNKEHFGMMLVQQAQLAHLGSYVCV